MAFNRGPATDLASGAVEGLAAGLGTDGTSAAGSAAGAGMGSAFTPAAAVGTTGGSIEDTLVGGVRTTLGGKVFALRDSGLIAGGTGVTILAFSV